METKIQNNIIGCFVSSQIGDKNGKEFRSYIWGEKGVCDILKKLNSKDYGDDLNLVLFKFKICPISLELDNIRELENYSKKEKAIAVNIIVDENNFFNKTEKERFEFLKKEILLKINLLIPVIKRNHLDTNLLLLISDLEQIFKTF
ncbi:MAG: Imm44 family immunity protein [bacterium]